MKIALVASKEVGLQINAEKNRIMFMSFEQNVGQNWLRRGTNGGLLWTR